MATASEKQWQQMLRREVVVNMATKVTLHCTAKYKMRQIGLLNCHVPVMDATVWQCGRNGNCGLEITSLCKEHVDGTCKIN